VNLDDTIIAWATGRASLARVDDAAGPARVAIIRATGPGVFRTPGSDAAARALVDVLDPSPSPPPAGAICGRSQIRLDGAMLPVRWIAARGPRTYSGQDTLELLIPAGPVIVPLVLAAMRAVPGVRDAEPGEFSARAFFLGRLSLAQAEAVARTISAQSRAALAAARALRDDEGAAAARLAAWRDEAATLLALVEAGIDFADQEGVVAIAPQELHARAMILAGALRDAAGDAMPAALAPSGEPAVMLLGPPNAGKSTLFNALAGAAVDASLVSPIAGTTRDARTAPWPMHVPGLGPVRARLIDAPGLDITSTDALDRAAQARTHAALREASLALLCDPHANFAPLAAVAGSTPALCIRTKADRAATASTSSLSVCALTGHGLDALRIAVAQALWPTDAAAASEHDLAAAAGEVMLLPAHRAALHSAALHLRAAATHTQTRANPEPALIAADLRAALDALGPLTGDIPPDEILGRIFGSFCIGK
jgi:tRNA modification GTPase